MSSEGYSCSEDSISPEFTEKNLSLDDITDHSEPSTQRLSPVSSCVSMKSDRSMEPPHSFSQASSDPSHQRSPLLCHRKTPICKSRSRSACVCDETCRGKTHNRMHAQPCACCGGSIPRCCMQQGAKSKVEVPRWGNILLPEVQKAVELGLVLLGRSGVGKSSSGNTILGRQAFEEDFSLSSVTKVCETRSSVISRWKVKITDTPDLSDESFVNCFSNASSIHAFLLVIRLGRISPEEVESIRRIREVIGSRALKHTLVLFTGRDLLAGKSFSELLDNSSVLKEILSVCEGGYHFFNNRDRTEIRQVEELLLKIEAVVYKNSVFNREENVQDDKNITEHTETGSSFIATLYYIISSYIYFCGLVHVALLFCDLWDKLIKQHKKKVKAAHMTDEMKARDIQTKKPMIKKETTCDK